MVSVDVKQHVYLLTLGIEADYLPEDEQPPFPLPHLGPRQGK